MMFHIRVWFVGEKSEQAVYECDGWQVTDLGTLFIASKGWRIAAFAPGHWLRVERMTEPKWGN